MHVMFDRREAHQKDARAIGETKCRP